MRADAGSTDGGDFGAGLVMGLGSKNGLELKGVLDLSNRFASFVGTSYDGLSAR
jgi:hypothetical protein